MSFAYYKNEFLKSNNVGLTVLEGQFTVDSTQTSTVANYKCSSIQGTGIANIALVATGVYQISLTQNFNKLLGFDCSIAGVNDTANKVAIASLVDDTTYVITTMGTSVQADWVVAGVPSDVTAQVGVAFVGSEDSSGATGTGYASPVISAAIYQVQMYGDPNTTINLPNPVSGTAPYFMFQTLVDQSNETLAAGTPTDTSIIRFRILLRNSGVKGAGE